MPVESREVVEEFGAGVVAAALKQIRQSGRFQPAIARRPRRFIVVTTRGDKTRKLRGAVSTQDGPKPIDVRVRELTGDERAGSLGRRSEAAGTTGQGAPPQIGRAQ